MEIDLKENEILVLRNVHGDMSSYNGFVWPKTGPVEAPDWIGSDICGHGLHGLPWGVGGNYFYCDSNTVWLLVVVDTSKDYRCGSGELLDKCKFKGGNVVYCGTREEAVSILLRHAPANTPIVFASQTAGDRSTQTAGYESTQTAGDRSTQKAGLNTVQITKYFDSACNQCKVVSRIITKAKADKWYFVAKGKWRLCTKDEALEAEKRISKVR